jgi:hypothetical protein
MLLHPFDLHLAIDVRLGQNTSETWEQVQHVVRRGLQRYPSRSWHTEMATDILLLCVHVIDNAIHKTMQWTDLCLHVDNLIGDPCDEDVKCELSIRFPHQPSILQRLAFTTCTTKLVSRPSSMPLQCKQEHQHAGACSYSISREEHPKLKVIPATGVYITVC